MKILKSRYKAISFLWIAGCCIWVILFIKLQASNSDTIIEENVKDTLSISIYNSDVEGNQESENINTAIPDKLSDTQIQDTKISSEKKYPENHENCIMINSAEIKELDALDGVGPVLAQRIIDFRKANGIFKNYDDLLKVKGIGPKKLEKIRKQICF